MMTSFFGNREHSALLDLFGTVTPEFRRSTDFRTLFNIHFDLVCLSVLYCQAGLAWHLIVSDLLIDCLFCSDNRRRTTWLHPVTGHPVQSGFIRDSGWPVFLNFDFVVWQLQQMRTGVLSGTFQLLIAVCSTE